MSMSVKMDFPQKYTVDPLMFTFRHSITSGNDNVNLTLCNEDIIVLMNITYMDLVQDGFISSTILICVMVLMMVNGPNVIEN